MDSDELEGESSGSEFISEDDADELLSFDSNPVS